MVCINFVSNNLNFFYLIAYCFMSSIRSNRFTSTRLTIYRILWKDKKLGGYDPNST